MAKTFAACLLAAAADPEDRVPYCSGDQSSRPMPHQSLHAPGANPGVPLGTNPGYEPVA